MKIQSFDNIWLLAHDVGDVGRTQGWFCGIPKGAGTEVKVPCFVHMYFTDSFGVAWYQKHFTFEKKRLRGRRCELRFGSAEYLCEVWLNGVSMGTHRGSEEPFSFDITDRLAENGENLLSVRVSKPYEKAVDGYDFECVPHRNQTATDLRPGACYNVFGFGRAVTLQLVPALRITDVYIAPNLETGTVDLEYTVMNSTGRLSPCAIRAEMGGLDTGERETEMFFPFTAEKGETVVKTVLKIDSPHPWSVDDPYLYFVSSSLVSKSSVDTVMKRCGFRLFEVRGDGFFYLNGKRFFLRCSHTGNCMPYSTYNIAPNDRLVYRDFVMAKAAGLNAVRFIAGAALPEQLDYCDEIGLMVYEEPLAGWLLGSCGRTKEIFTEDLLSVVRRDRSHPCVAVWGMLNEMGNREEHRAVCEAARDALPELRKLDRTRLVLFSSGRWDRDLSQGSLSNPYSDKWECLWNAEGSGAENETGDGHGISACSIKCGDIHMYPHIPLTDEAYKTIRSLGSDSKRPFFLSEFGIGSAFDSERLCRKFEEEDASPDYPDVKLVAHMNGLFLEDLKKYGFNDDYSFPSAIMKESQRLHSRQRTLCFDLLRSNPYCCGYSVTGLLDHSTCGEGLWTFMREWKPGIVEALEDGFAPLRWCLFMSSTHLFSGKPFTIEGVLANEDVLKPGCYPVGIRITGENGTVYKKDITLSLTSDELKLLAVPVFKEAINVVLPEGEYTFGAEIQRGAAASGEMKFYVSDSAKTDFNVREICCSYVPESIKRLLSDRGAVVRGLPREGKKALVLVGEIPAEKRGEEWEKLNTLMEKGCRVFAAERFAFEKDGDLGYYIPVADKPANLPSGRDHSDWLYHFEYLAKRGSSVFDGLKTGVMDWDYYGDMINGHWFSGGGTPDDTYVMCFKTGAINEEGYESGFNVGTYNVGKGALTLSSLGLFKTADTNPASERLLLNILENEYKKL